MTPFQIIKTCLVPVFLGLALCANAFALDLSEHEQITRQAANEFNFCFGDLISPTTLELLIAEDRDEDTNLVRKWSTYAHFYNPEKRLHDMVRYDSSVRVMELEREIDSLVTQKTSTAYAEVLSELGHLIHHLQDATSPSHIVPVMHSFSDGFENFTLSPQEMPAERYSLSACRKIVQVAASDSPLRILQDTAQATLNHTRAPLNAQKGDGKMQTFTWEAFWKTSKAEEFGEYGIFGNNFGAPFVFQGCERFRVARPTYVKFRRDQIRLAVDATLRTFAWVFGKEMQIPPAPAVLTP
ncbi:hypothetical protein WDW86_01200 [Bdellovibrionota bacterium FG-2]